MVEAIGLNILRYITAYQPNLVLFDTPIRFRQRDSASTEALHFAADENDAALESVENREIVVGLAILGDRHLVGIVSGPQSVAQDREVRANSGSGGYLHNGQPAKEPPTEAAGQDARRDAGGRSRAQSPAPSGAGSGGGDRKSSRPGAALARRWLMAHQVWIK